MKLVVSLEDREFVDEDGCIKEKAFFERRDIEIHDDRRCGFTSSDGHNRKETRESGARCSSRYVGDCIDIVIPEGTEVIIGDELGFLGGLPDGAGKVICVCRNDIRNARSLTMPDSVKIIGAKAFEHCAALESVSFSRNINTIGLSAFLNCGKLRNISLPKSIRNIESWAFANCGLAEVDYEGSILELDAVETRGAFGNVGKFVCSDCVVDFAREKYFIDHLEYANTVADWNKNWGESWINRRTREIQCADGLISHR